MVLSINEDMSLRLRERRSVLAIRTAFSKYTNAELGVSKIALDVL